MRVGVGWGWGEVWFEILFKHDGPGPYPELDAGGWGVTAATPFWGCSIYTKFIFLWGGGGGVTDTPPLTLVKTIIQVSFL